MAVGFLCGKIKIITKDVNKGLSSLSLYVINPIVIFISYQRDFSVEIAKNLAGAFVLAVISFAVQMLLSFVFIRKKNNKDYPVERLSVMLSNCSYIGLPLVQSVYGAEGVIYLTAYVTVFHLISWTYGLSLMSGERSLRKILKGLTSPALISVFGGLIFFLAGIKLPDIIYQSMTQIGNMNTPVAMMIAGATLSATNLKSALGKFKTYYLCAIKLLIAPLCVLLVIFKASSLGAANEIINVVLIATACPTATNIMMFSHRFGKNSVYASEIFTICTLGSVASIPFVLWVASLLGV